MANRHKAQEFKKGGKVQPEPEHARKLERAAGLKTGGAVTPPAPAPKLKTGGKVKGMNTGGRLDKRARGGGVGADKHPFSSAKLK